MIKLAISSVLLGLAIGIQISVRTESPDLSEIRLLTEYVYWHIATVILFALSALIGISEYDGDDSK